MPTTLPDDILMRPTSTCFTTGTKCKQRILVVADGRIDFCPTSGFGLTRFLAELAKTTPAPVITKAHRGDGAGADIQNFRFHTAVIPVIPSNYDILCLIGFDRTPAAGDYSAEVRVIAKFMNTGGGVFATGDHEDLGYGLCGQLPRIRKMREWRTIPMTNERIDTVTNPGPDLATQFYDQSDEFPQRIFPKYYGSGTSWAPHPLLRSPLGDVDVKPDHAPRVSA